MLPEVIAVTVESFLIGPPYTGNLLNSILLKHVGFLVGSRGSL